LRKQGTSKKKRKILEKWYWKRKIKITFAKNGPIVQRIPACRLLASAHGRQGTEVS
jgi:hypothetical protein